MSPRAKARSSAKPVVADGAQGTKAPARAPRARRTRLPTDGTLPPLEAILPKAAPKPVAEPTGASLEPVERTEPESPEPAPSDLPLGVRLATEAELEDWDTHAVASPNGHVYQSRGWADHRAALGWQTWHLVFDDGFRLLVLGEPRGVAGGWTAYASRGPLPEADPELTARRARAAAEFLAQQGAIDLTIDGETPAASGLGDALDKAGFEPTEELQRSRHRMDVRLGPDDLPNSDEKTIFASFVATTRNAIRQADRHGLRVKRLDAGGGRIEQDAPDALLGEFDAVDVHDSAAVDSSLLTFYRMLEGANPETNAAVEPFLHWMRRAIAAGHAIYLQAEHPQDGPVAGAVFYRHGHRLSYALAGHDDGLRRSYPGAVPLLVWRGIQIALDERRTRVDLGGVDIEGARTKPDKGDPTYGEYVFRESFGGRWVQLTGAHRRTLRPMQNIAGRFLGKLASLRR